MQKILVTAFNCKVQQKQFCIICNKINVKKPLMQSNDYEQILIKCEYITAICDTLLKQLENDNLSANFQKIKLKDDQDQSKKYLKYSQISNSIQQNHTNDKIQFQIKVEQLNKSIKKHKIQIKALKSEINTLQKARYENIKTTRENTLKIRQISEIEFQLTQMRKLINCQMQNFNFLELNRIQLKQGIEKFEKRQSAIKNKINSLLEKQKDFLNFRDLEQNYNDLLNTKKKILEQKMKFDLKEQSHASKRASSIAQSNQNLIQMQNYERQLNTLIKEQKIIINEIQNREILNFSEVKIQQNSLNNDIDDNLFDQQISNLRKTIANRKFKQRAKNIQTQKKFQFINNNPTPKNKSIKQDSFQQRSIFKIQIEPISHFESPKQSRKLQINRHSVPINIKRENPGYQSIKQGKVQKSYSSHKNHNTSAYLNTNQIQTLKNILRKKQDSLKQVLRDSSFEDVNNQSFSIKPEHLKKPRAQIFNKERYQTEPTTLRNQQQCQIGPNSRFIQRLIEQNSPKNLQRLKSNVRIKTKKSETQKYKLMQLQSQASSKQKKIKTTSESPKNLPFKKDNARSLEKTSEKIKANQKKLEFNKTQQKQKRTAYTWNKDQFQDSSSQISKQSSFKPRIIKYQSKVETSEHQKGNIKTLISKIQKLKDEDSKKDIKIQKNKDQQTKVKVIKLTNKRKYGNSISLLRKGKAEGIQQQESEDELELPKIQEEDQSIRNTKNSIAN